MFSMHQLIKALRKLQATNANANDLTKSLRQAAAMAAANGAGLPPSVVAALMSTTRAVMTAAEATAAAAAASPSSSAEAEAEAEDSNEPCQTSQESVTSSRVAKETKETTLTSKAAPTLAVTTASVAAAERNSSSISSRYSLANANVCVTSVPVLNFNETSPLHLRPNQQIHNLYQQQLQQFHTQNNQTLNAKQKQTQFSMSSLAAEPLVRKPDELVSTLNSSSNHTSSTPNRSDCHMASNSNSAASSSAATGQPCFNTGLSDILQFMELIGNLKHTKRTGWVLRDVNDCESISGHMYRMSMMTFLLDGSEGLNQIRCMELALVHDLAESLVGDITPFCGISKGDKRAMEFKAMEDICKLIEPRGKRIMELFEEYEEGVSAESRFVKDLDRLDMIMQAFEYEKRDDCLLKHQEFFDSTKGKFNHPFVKKLVDEIYRQRDQLAKARGATPPPVVHVPNMDDPAPSSGVSNTNGHCNMVPMDEIVEHEPLQKSKSTS